MLTLLFLPSTPAPPVDDAADLMEAIVMACHDDATLTSLCGRNEWLWLNEAPHSEPIPFATISNPASDISWESTGDDGLRSAIARQQYQVDVFHSSRSTARAIGQRIVAVLNLLEPTYDSGYLIQLFPTRSTDALDPDRGPGGVDVWHRTILFDALEGSNH